MKVTCEAKNIRLVDSQNSQKLASASITLDGAFVVTGLSVISGRNGLFVNLPNQKGVDKDGNVKYYDTAFPLSKELRQEINNVVLDAYQSKLNELSMNAQNRSSGEQAPPPIEEDYGSPEMY